jgi:cytochrome c-type biogenesis protein CcmH/NrfG
VEQERTRQLFGWIALGKALINERNFRAAVEPLTKAIELVPGLCARRAGLTRALADGISGTGDDSMPKRQTLEKFVSLNAETIDPRLRLFEMAAAKKDWPAVCDVRRAVPGGRTP